MTDNLEQQMPPPPPEELTPETKEQIIKFVKEGVARPWYAPRPNSTDGSLDLVGISMPAFPDTFLLEDDEGMRHIGTGEQFLVVSLDGSMSVIATPFQELQQRLKPNKNNNSVNYVRTNLWDDDIIPEIGRGNATLAYRSYIESEKPHLMNIVKGTFNNAEQTIQKAKPNQPTTPIKLA